MSALECNDPIGRDGHSINILSISSTSSSLNIDTLSEPLIQNLFAHH